MLNNMNKIINLIVAFAALTFCFSCNNEWEDEQFAHYVGFKAPINSDGCTTVHVRYKTDGSTIKYQLPLVVSGSTVHTSDIEAIVELDADSLYTLNMKNIGERRKDIWYQDLSIIDFCQINSLTTLRGEKANAQRTHSTKGE